MLDIKVYLHAKTKRLQPIIYMLAGSSFVLKAVYLPVNQPYYYFWFGFNVLFSLILLVLTILQLSTNYSYPKLASFFNIRIGFLLVTGSIIKLFSGFSDLAFATLITGTLLMCCDHLESYIQKLPHLEVYYDYIAGRNSLLVPFQYYWHEIEAIEFNRARVKISLHNGEVIYYRVAKEVTDSTMIRTAQFYCEKIKEERREFRLQAA